MRFLTFSSDKYVHFIAGEGIFALFFVVLHNAFLSALSAVVLAAALKELWDSRGHGTVEFADFVATVLGGAAVLFYTIIILWRC